MDKGVKGMPIYQPIKWKDRTWRVDYSAKKVERSDMVGAVAGRCTVYGAGGSMGQCTVYGLSSDPGCVRCRRVPIGCPILEWQLKGLRNK